jgi:hypothetical protein
MRPGRTLRFLLLVLGHGVKQSRNESDCDSGYRTLRGDHQQTFAVLLMLTYEGGRLIKEQDS